MTLPAPQSDEAEKFVAAWLRANPGFLAADPALYAAMDPPPRIHGERVADHMAARIAAAEAHARSLSAMVNGVLAASRANAAAAERIQRAVLELLRARDVMGSIGALPDLLGLECVSLCAERPAPPGFRTLDEGDVARLVGHGREAALRRTPAADAALHGEAAALVGSEALLRFPVSPAGRPALLALGAREADAFDPGQATDLLQFLAAAVAAALQRA
jgi:uncharacterized protein YigA (DUF484 family)